MFECYGGEAQNSRGFAELRHHTGLSSDPVARLDWKLLISIEFADTSTATRFERYLRTGSENDL